MTTNLVQITPFMHVPELEIIVEPLPAEKLLLVITAYPVDAGRT